MNNLISLLIYANYFYDFIIQFKYLNNNIFRFSLIGGINIIIHTIFMKIRIVHTLRAGWLMVSVLSIELEINLSS